MAKHHYELEWNKDLETIYKKLKHYWMCLPSIMDVQHGLPRLPSIFEEIREAYELPWNTHKQALLLDRITNPTKDIRELIELMDKYNLRHNIDFFHQNPDPRWNITKYFAPHRHTPGGVKRSIDKDGKPIESFTGKNPGEKDTPMYSTHSQLTFPFINSDCGETVWSTTYKGFGDSIEERSDFTEEEIVERYRLKDKPVLFDVMTWHGGRNEKNNRDRLLIGIATKFDSFEESVEFFKSHK